MPSLTGRVFNALVRLHTRRRYGFDEFALAREARRRFGSPKLFQRFHTRGLKIETVAEEKARGEWLVPEPKKDGAIFYVHGGGFVSCSPETHRPITATLARLTRFPVFSVDYRLAPEHRFPAGPEDVFNAYLWLLEQNVRPEKLAVAGDSAGGGLTLSLLLRLRDERLPLPACAVCFSPWADLTGKSASHEANGDADDMFYPENNDEFAHAYLGDAAVDAPYASPVFGEFENFPPVLFQVGSTEMLVDDSRVIHEKILQTGGESRLEIYDDIFHCWQMLSGVVPEAGRSLRQAAEFIRQHAEKA